MKYKEIVLTQANPSADISNPAGGMSISGVFGTASLSYTLEGDSVAIDSGIVAAETFYMNSSHLTFTASTPDGTTAISIKWYYDSNNSDETRARKYLGNNNGNG